MIPLLLANINQKLIVKMIKAKDDSVVHHLNELGLVEQSEIEVVSKNGNNLILKVKESRIALSKELASKVMVKE